MANTTDSVGRLAGFAESPTSAAPTRTVATLEAELVNTYERLAEAEDVLNAIRSGDVDAVMVHGEHGEQVYTLAGADVAYRELIETMIEGALTLSNDGIILYCNSRLAETLGRPIDEIMGTSLRDYVVPEDQLQFASILAQARLPALHRSRASRPASQPRRRALAQSPAPHRPPCSRTTVAPVLRRR